MRFHRKHLEPGLLSILLALDYLGDKRPNAGYIRSARFGWSGVHFGLTSITIVLSNGLPTGATKSAVGFKSATNALLVELGVGRAT